MSAVSTGIEEEASYVALNIVERATGMVDVLVCGAEGEMSRYPADDGGRSQNRLRPITIHGLADIGFGMECENAED